MQGGETIRAARCALEDPATGRTVQRIVPNGVHAMLPYFTRERITEDNAGVLVSVERDGAWWPCMAHPDEGSVTCLTAEPMLGPHYIAVCGADKVH